MTWGLTDAGLVIPREADFLTEMQARYEAAVGLSVDWDADQFQQRIIGVAANRLGAVAELLQAVDDSMDPAAARGLQLDILASIAGVARLPATKARAVVTLTGTAGTVVVAGKMVEGGGADDRARWVLDDDVTIGGGGTGTGLAIAQDAGALVAVAGTIDKIVTPVSGWTAVANAADATPGTDRESNEDFRVRRLQAIQGVGSRSTESIRARLLEIEGVTSCSVIDNPTAAIVVVQGITLDPHSVAVIVYPNTITTAEKEEAALALYAHVADGIETMGSDVIATVTSSSGVERVVRWDYAALQNVNVAITVNTLAQVLVVGDVDDLITAAVQAYFADLDPGDTAYFLGLYGAIGAVPGVRKITMTLAGGGADIAANLNRKLTPSPIAVV